MALFTFANPWLFTFGILGNLISFLVYLSPMPTFYRIVNKKSTEEFHSVPYVMALFSAMLMIYYATLKVDATLLITINSFGCVIETIYISLYLAYAPKKALVFTLKLVILLNFVGIWVIVGITHYLVKAPKRVQVIGGINLLVSLCVFAAPLSIMKKVVQTKSVEFMPFWLSFFLSFSAVMWFFYGLLTKDIYVALPNIFGFLFGIVQMVLYAIYKLGREELKLPQVVKPTATSVMTPEIHPINSDQNKDETRTKSEEKESTSDLHHDDDVDKNMDASNQV